MDILMLAAGIRCSALASVQGHGEMYQNRTAASVNFATLDKGHLAGVAVRRRPIGCLTPRTRVYAKQLVEYAKSRDPSEKTIAPTTSNKIDTTCPCTKNNPAPTIASPTIGDGDIPADEHNFQRNRETRRCSGEIHEHLYKNAGNCTAQATNCGTCQATGGAGRPVRDCRITCLGSTLDKEMPFVDRGGGPPPSTASDKNAGCEDEDTAQDDLDNGHPYRRAEVAVSNDGDHDQFDTHNDVGDV